MKLEKYTKVVIRLFETRINEKNLFILQGFFFFQYCALNMHVFAYVCVCVYVWGNNRNTVTSYIRICSQLNIALLIYCEWKDLLGDEWESYFNNSNG